MVESQTNSRNNNNHYIVKGRISLYRDKAGFIVQYITRKSGSNRYNRALEFTCNTNDPFFYRLASFMNTHDTGELLQENGLCVRQTTIKFHMDALPIKFYNDHSKGVSQRFMIPSGTYCIHSVEHKGNSLTNRLGVFR